VIVGSWEIVGGKLTHDFIGNASRKIRGIVGESWVMSIRGGGRDDSLSPRIVGSWVSLIGPTILTHDSITRSPRPPKGPGLHK